MQDPEALIAFLRQRRDEHMRFVRLVSDDTVDSDPSVQYADDDLGQMVDGVIEVIVEAIEGERTDKLDFYVSVVVPGLIASGSSVAGVLDGTVRWGMLVIDDVARHFAAQDPAQVALALANFFGRYAIGMMEAGLACGGDA